MPFMHDLVRVALFAYFQSGTTSKLQQMQSNINSAEFYKQAIIPKDVSLEIENFEDFYNKCKEILAAKIRKLLG